MSKKRIYFLCFFIFMMLFGLFWLGAKVDFKEERVNRTHFSEGTSKKLVVSMPMDRRLGLLVKEGKDMVYPYWIEASFFVCVCLALFVSPLLDEKQKEMKDIEKEPETECLREYLQREFGEDYFLEKQRNEALG